MINTILKYDYEDLGDYIVSDYTSKKIDLYNILQEMKDNNTLSDYFDIYRMMDDDKLERISYSIYGTTDYWDILLQLNDRNPLFEMSYNLDTIVDSVEIFWKKYSNNVYFQSPLNDTVLNELILAEIENMKKQNEIYRLIYIIKTSKMNEFLKILRERDYI